MSHMDNQADKKDGQASLNSIDELSFEQALNELENIVEQLEAGDVPLERAVALFQKGIKLSGICHRKLEKVEQEIEIMLEEEGNWVVRPFPVEEDDV